MFDQEWTREKFDRHLMSARLIKYGIGYLDDALLGILPNDLILVGARTGRGKTELATNIAYNAANQGKTVVFYALEADRWEIQRRMKYRKLNQFYHLHYESQAQKLKFPNYREWLVMGYHPEWDALEKEAEEELRRETHTLEIRYKGDSFTAKQFTQELETMGDVDLIIIDHLHYFDLGDANETAGLKQVIHAIRNSALHHEKPIILLAHLRKGDKVSKKALPELDDFHGHSDIVKVATNVILLAPAPDSSKGLLGLYPTYFHIAKSRTASHVTPFVGVLGFDFHKNGYSKKYLLQRASFVDDPEPVTEIPAWAKNAISHSANVIPVQSWYEKKED